MSSLRFKYQWQYEKKAQVKLRFSTKLRNKENYCGYGIMLRALTCSALCKLEAPLCFSKHILLPAATLQLSSVAPPHGQIIIFLWSVYSTSHLTNLIIFVKVLE